ncbi:MAG: type II toxin-antitoxin system RelE/ParE family toxin [Candidatus Kapabacteria bacterium]|jgi:proteic killer suppression protein|nr:type II toxin-antitoxin system RelE/ParE family toxin [Candidatus Kapabacteria bacterium]
MIHSFGDKGTEALFHGKRYAAFPSSLEGIARRKLDMLHAASSEEDLRVPPGNRFKRLSGDKTGICSIRINQQWRIEFRIIQGHLHDVRISKHYDE